MKTGLERLVTDHAAQVRGRRVGVLCHHASFIRSSGHRLVFAPHALQAAGAVVDRLFGPEHGVWGTAQDMIPVSGGLDPATGLPVVSLYGQHAASLRPRPEALQGLDAVVIDLQDIGARYYTYVATAVKVVEVAAELGIEAIICDRPNPIGGAVEGNRVVPELRSFVGAFDIPQRHGMTLGELVQMVTGGKATVMAVDGWQRDQMAHHTGLPWIPPSPNMPTPATALVYPGLCLLEGTELSEGRGTTTPFEVFGAPFVEPFVFAQALEALNLPGVTFRPHVFEPTFQKHRGQPCGGVQLLVHGREALQPVRLGLAILSTLFRLYPQLTRWREAEYEYVTDRKAIDLLLGEPGLSDALVAGAALPDLTRGFAEAEAHFRKARAPWLLYP